MGCKYVFYKGRAYRVSRVTPITPVINIGATQPKLRLAMLGLNLAVGSPTVTIEELEHATIRVFDKGELGFLAEAKFSPDGQPIYHYVDPDLADRIINNTLSPAEIAHLFQIDPPIDY